MGFTTQPMMFVTDLKEQDKTPTTSVRRSYEGAWSKERAGESRDGESTADGLGVQYCTVSQYSPHRHLYPTQLYCALQYSVTIQLTVHKYK